MRYDSAYENSLHFSPRFQRYVEGLAQRLVEEHDLRNKDVVEVGCGSGEFLRMICRMGGNRGLGFDPAFRPEDEAEAGTGTVNTVRVLTTELSPDHPPVPVDFLFCRHVLEHVADPLGFLRGLGQWLGPGSDAVVYLEVPDARYTLERGGIWDLIYEHRSYFTWESLVSLVRRAGFAPRDGGEAFGGQYLYLTAKLAFAPEEESGYPPDASYDPTGSVDLAHSVAVFQSRFHETVEGWRRRIAEAEAKGYRVALWGAGSKGVTFLNVVDPGSTVSWVVDINPRKHGRFIPGTGHQVVSPETLEREVFHGVLVMNPLYLKEIEEDLLARGMAADLWPVSAL